MLTAAAAAPASSRQVVAFEAPRELLSDAARGPTLDEIQGFGITRIRQLVYWRDFAPAPGSRTKPAFDASDPAAYPARTWDRLDRLVAAARERGLEVQLTLTGPGPQWATAAKRDGITRPSPRQFAAWVTAVGRRYGEHVASWSIWNEPNQPQFLLPQYVNGRPASPPIYRALYRAAYAALRATPANAHDEILIGETSPRGNAHVVRPLAFLRGMLCLNAKWQKARRCAELRADGYAQHAYTTTQGPRFKPPSPDDVTIGVLSRLVHALDRAGRAKAVTPGLPIYLTEFGIQSSPDRVSGVSLARQAAYLAISEHIAYVNPRVRLFSQYLMTDDGPQSQGYLYGGFQSGLRHADGKPKPACAGFRLPLAAESYGRSDVLWGLVRPERSTTQVTILAAGKGGRWSVLKSVSTTSAGVFGLKTRHRAGQRYRVRWTAPDGKTYTGPAVQAY